MDAEQARQKVFAHLPYIDRLCKKRFIQDQTLAEEAQSYVLDKLEEKNWYRIRQWSEQANVGFRTYLTIVIQRLLTQYQRHKQGYIRPPSWLPDEPVWRRAFILLRIKRWSRTETIGILMTEYKPITQEEVEQPVNEILQRSREPRLMRSVVPIEDQSHLPDTGYSPDDYLQNQDQHRLATLLLQYIEGGKASDLPPVLLNQINQLNECLPLNAEDRLFLRMYFVSNLTISKIAKRLHLTGDPYKRYKKIIKQLYDAIESLDLEGNTIN